MGDSVQVACVIPDAADAAFQVQCLKRSAYAAVLRALCAQSNLLSWAKQGCLLELRNELKILESEHRECLGKARSNKQISSLSAGLHSKGNTCNTEVMKDTPDLACVLPDPGDTVFQVHCLERAAYASVLRAFSAVTNRLSGLQVKLLIRLRNELRISHIEHKELLVEVSSNENIKSLRKFSLANLSVLTKADPSFDAHAVVHDKIGSTGQVSTSSTSCLSLAQRSPISEHSMSTTRDIVVSDSSNGAKEGLYFEPHAVVSAKRLKSVNGHAQAYLKCAPSDQLPVAVSAVMSKDRTDDTLDSETISYEVKSGCSSSPIFQEKHSESNAGQVPSCVDHSRQESGKRKAEVPGMRGSSLGVMNLNCGIKSKRHRNKDSDLEHGSEIVNLFLTANLLHKVEMLLREDPDQANLEKAKSILKVQEKDLLDALVKLSEVSYDAANFSANGQPDNVNTHDDGKGEEEVLPKPMKSSDETPPGTSKLGGGGAGSHAKDQGVAATALSSSSATPTTGGTVSSSSIVRPLLLAPPPLPPLVPASPSSAPAAFPAPSKKGSTRTVTMTTVEQRWRMWEFAHRVGWSIHKAGADAVAAVCAEAGVSRRAVRKWMNSNRHLSKTPPPSSPPLQSRTQVTAEQRERMREFAYRIGWSIQKASAGAVDAFCAEFCISRYALKSWMAKYRHLAKIPPPSSLPSPPLPSHQQDHPPAAVTPPQGPVAAEQGASPEPEAAAPADDGGEEDKSEEASEVLQDDGGEEDESEEASEVTKLGRGHRSRVPNRRYGGLWNAMW
ncbi:unnamed protein product [Urochloa decumbens]|uniref:ENT domain-containing protein n=1 Tax=Urochloa decumbens TaxID=240449 RepID=A0ABC8YJJ7_9POAL